jgi:hypothetical protein
MAATKVTTAELAPAITTDANGWTIADFGTVKMYSRTWTFEWGSMSAGGYASIGSISTPTGETEASIMRTWSAGTNGNSPFFSFHLEGNTVYMRNLSSGAVDVGTVRISATGMKAV